MKSIILNALILLLILGSIIFLNNSFSNNNNFAVILDTGKADCIVIKNNDNIIVIDTAESEDFSKIKKFLDSSNITQVDYLIITHFDKDHIGGASQLIDNYQVLNVIEPSYLKESEYVDDYRDSLKSSPQTVLTILDKELELDFIGMKLIPTSLEDVNSNNNSIICELVLEGKNILLMGDAEEKRLDEYLSDNNLNNNYDFIKMPHHGSYNDMLESLIQYADPKAVGITCSSKNPADEETLELLDKYNIKTYLTEYGNIDILEALK